MHEFQVGETVTWFDEFGQQSQGVIVTQLSPMFYEVEISQYDGVSDRAILSENDMFGVER